MKRGDRDCSSAVCEAWELALAGTDWEGAVTRYNTTWSMKELFLNSGLFEWKPMSFDAEPGDVYLDIDEHTAMCVQNDGATDLLAEFSISETGDIDGEPGCGIVDVEFDEVTLGPQGWFEKNMRNGALIGLTVYYDTPDPSATGWWYAKYRVHWLGDEPGWGKWEIDDEDGGAGNDCDQVDMIELTIMKR